MHAQTKHLLAHVAVCSYTAIINSIYVFISMYVTYAAELI